MGAAVLHHTGRETSIAVLVEHPGTVVVVRDSAGLEESGPRPVKMASAGPVQTRQAGAEDLWVGDHGCCPLDEVSLAGQRGRYEAPHLVANGLDECREPNHHRIHAKAESIDLPEAPAHHPWTG